MLSSLKGVCERVCDSCWRRLILKNEGTDADLITVKKADSEEVIRNLQGDLSGRHLPWFNKNI